MTYHVWGGKIDEDAGDKLINDVETVHEFITEI